MRAAEEPATANKGDLPSQRLFGTTILDLVVGSLRTASADPGIGEYQH